VARLNPRLAAGVGVVTAYLLIGGPGMAAALADEGESGSDRGSSSERDDGYGRGDSKSDERDDGGNASNGGSSRGDNNAKRDSNDSPRVRVGSGREDTQQLMPSDSSDVGGGSGSTGGSTAGEGSSSDHPGSPAAGFERPRVTVGNGRSPGIQIDDPEPRWRGDFAPEPAPAPAPPPPPPPPPPPAPSWVDRIYTPPAIPKQLGVAPSARQSDPLWGIAGLLLIPAAGAALGYRQAKAAQAAERLGRP
jgi:hypothetical protein